MAGMRRHVIVVGSLAALAVDAAALFVIPQVRMTKSAVTQASNGPASAAESAESSPSQDSTSSSPSPSATSSGDLKDGTFTGALITTGRGDVQVRITVGNGTITAVDPVVYPQENPTSLQVNGQAIPVYVQESLKTQSAEIQLVTGATETFTGFTGSLQDAINQAKG